MSIAPLRAVEDEEYLLKRVEAEARAADQANCETAAAAHRQLASGYLDLLFCDPLPRTAGQVAAVPTDAVDTVPGASTTPFMILPPAQDAIDFSDLLIQMA
jgi:hypothetical protein